MRTRRCIHVNCFNRLKMRFFKQFKDQNSGWKHGKQTNDPIFVYFFHSNRLEQSFLYIFKNIQSKFIFMGYPVWILFLIIFPVQDSHLDISKVTLQFIRWNLGQNILQIFSNIRVSPFQKSTMSCLNQYLLAKN